MNKKIIVIIVISLGIIFAFSIFLIKEFKQEKETIKIGYFKGIGNIPFIVAYEKGFFSKEGLDVELVYYGNKMKQLISSVEAGALHCSLRSKPSIISAISEGADICLLGDIFQKDNDSNDSNVSIFSLYVRSDSICAKDNSCLLKLGYSKGGIEEIIVNSLIKNNKIPWHNIKHINVRHGEKVAFINSGKVDAILLEPDNFLMLKDNFRLKKVVDSNKVVPNSLFGAVFCSHSVLKENPDLSRKIRKAMSDADDFINKNPEIVKEIIKKDSYYGNYDFTDLIFPVFNSNLNTNQDIQRKIIEPYYNIGEGNIIICP